MDPWGDHLDPAELLPRVPAVHIDAKLCGGRHPQHRQGRSESLGDISSPSQGPALLHALGQLDVGALARSDSFGGSGGSLVLSGAGGLASGPSLQREAPGKDKKKSKLKTKPQPAAKPLRTMKFHEYKVTRATRAILSSI